MHAPEDILFLEYDYIDIWTGEKASKSIRNTLIQDYALSENKIKSCFDDYKSRLLEKYKKLNDSEAVSAIEVLKRRRGFAVLNFHPKSEHKPMRVYLDESAEMKYVLFEKKRMYLKRNYPTFFENAIEYASNFWYEQDENSPHLYMDEDVCVREGDVLVDAGACEGNFSLHNIDKVKKVYLIECEDDWIEALKLTFAPWKDKVVLCKKYLTDMDDGKDNCTLDSLLPAGEILNFIKMDIEGAELSALKGATNILKRSPDVRCSICTYHKHDDERVISEFFDSIGFEHWHSKGYMFFYPDNYALEHLELRRGILRARKRKELLF